MVDGSDHWCHHDSTLMVFPFLMCDHTEQLRLYLLLVTATFTEELGGVTIVLYPTAQKGTLPLYSYLFSPATPACGFLCKSSMMLHVSFSSPKQCGSPDSNILELDNIQHCGVIHTVCLLASCRTSAISSLASCSLSGLFAHRSLASVSLFFCSMAWASCQRCHAFIRWSNELCRSHQRLSFTSDSLLNLTSVILSHFHNFDQVQQCTRVLGGYVCVKNNPPYPHSSQQTDEISNELREAEGVVCSLVLM